MKQTFSVSKQFDSKWENIALKFISSNTLLHLYEREIGSSIRTICICIYIHTFICNLQVRNVFLIVVFLRTSTKIY